MPRKQSKDVPEGNCPVPDHDEFGSIKPTMIKFVRKFKERFDRTDKQCDELTRKTRETKQRFVNLQHKAQQPRLATEPVVEPGHKDSQACGGRRSRSSGAR